MTVVSGGLKHPNIYLRGIVLGKAHRMDRILVSPHSIELLLLGIVRKFNSISSRECGKTVGTAKNRFAVSVFEDDLRHRRLGARR